MTDARDCNGPWYGHYSGVGEANGFIALIADAAGRLTGTVTERDDSGLTDLRRATIDGTRTGDAVRFVKQYDGDVFIHAVEYRGTLSGDGQLIAGHWAIGTWTGAFVMEREVFAADALEDEAEAPVDADGAVPAGVAGAVPVSAAGAGPVSAIGAVPVSAIGTVPVSAIGAGR